MRALRHRKSASARQISGIKNGGANNEIKRRRRRHNPRIVHARCRASRSALPARAWRTRIKRMKLAAGRLNQHLRQQ